MLITGYASSWGCDRSILTPQSRPLRPRNDVELDFHLVFHFHSAADDADRLDPEVALLQHRGATIVPIPARDRERRRPRLAVNREPAGDGPSIRARRFNRRRRERDVGIPGAVEHLWSEHASLHLRALVRREFR